MTPTLAVSKQRRDSGYWVRDGRKEPVLGWIGCKARGRWFATCRRCLNVVGTATDQPGALRVLEDHLASEVAA